MKLKYLSILALGLAGLMATSACVVEDRPVPAREVVVHAPPPAEIVEVVPASPGPNWLWQKGHWRWDGNRYYWQKGRWAERPAQYHAWVAPHWEPRGGSYVFIEGRWQ